VAESAEILRNFRDFYTGAMIFGAKMLTISTANSSPNFRLQTLLNHWLITKKIKIKFPQLQDVVPTMDSLATEFRRFENRLHELCWTGLTTQGQSQLEGRMGHQFPDRYYDGPNSDDGGYTRLGQSNKGND
jgi:hypothetical protein